MLKRPGRTYKVLVPLALIAFAISATGNGKRPSTGGMRYWVAALGWAGFGLLGMTTILYTLALGARAIARRGTPTTLN